MFKGKQTDCYTNKASFSAYSMYAVAVSQKILFLQIDDGGPNEF